MIEARLRTKISKEELAAKVGMIVTESDSNMMLTGPARLRKPDGQLLCVYLPGALKDEMAESYPVLTTIRGKTENRGLASGSMRVPDKVVDGKVIRTRSMPVLSSMIGAADPGGVYRYCRLTSFTAKETEKMELMGPLFRRASQLFEEYVPDRFMAQRKEAAATHPEWVIPGTCFTTVTINNTYATGVHLDKGDLGVGFSVLAVTRKGEFTGGHLTFPEFRVSIDMQDGDVAFMDAHGAYHGNTPIVCKCGNTLSQGPCKDCDAERISTVMYFREKMVACGTQEEEYAKRLAKIESV